MILKELLHDCMTSAVVGPKHLLFCSKRWNIFCRNTLMPPIKGFPMLYKQHVSTMLCLPL